MYPVIKDRTYVVECGNGGLISKDYYDSGTQGSGEEEYDDAVKIYAVTIDFWSLSATSGEFRGKIGVSNLVHQVVYYELSVDYEIDYFDDEDSSGEYWTELSTDREFYRWWKDLLEEEEDGNIRILDLSFS